VATISESTIQKAYIAYYGRPADTEGLLFWSQALDSLGGDLSGVIDSFGNSLEFISRYGHLNNSDLITGLYQQLFNREPETEGFNFWLNELNSGVKTLQSIAVEVMLGAQNNDAAIIENKLSTANLFTALYPLGSFEYSGTSAAESVKTILDQVANSDDFATDLVTNFLGVTDISTNNPSGYQGTDGVSEVFIYEIDSNNFVIESREAVDIVLNGFNVNEDVLIFRDVNNGTTNTASFINEAYITSEENTLIVFDTILANDNDIVVAEEGVKLTISGVSDFTAIDYYVG